MHCSAASACCSAGTTGCSSSRAPISRYLVNNNHGEFSCGRGNQASFRLLGTCRHLPTFVLELDSCIFFLRHNAPLVCPLPVSISKSSLFSSYVASPRKRDVPAPVGLLVPNQTAEEFGLPSARGAQSPSKLSLQLLTGSTSEASIPAHNQGQLRSTAKHNSWTWVKDEVRDIVVYFLESRGLSPTLSADAVTRAPTFITHLTSLLQSCYPARYLSGEELTGNEIRMVLQPYLDSLVKQHGGDVDDILNRLPSDAVLADLTSFVPQPGVTSEVLSGYPLLFEHFVDGKLPPSLSYCFSIGLNPAQVEATVKKFPPIVGYSFEGKIEKVVNFILALGVPSSLIPRIVLKRPQLFGCNVEENLKPSVRYLENLGVDRMRWGRILCAFPHMLTYSRAKTSCVFQFLMQVGVSQTGAAKILGRFPHVVGYSVELKLKPMAAYFYSIGIEDFGRVITRSPQTLGLSLEGNVKPTVEFLLGLGFSMEQLKLVLNRFPQILGLNVMQNLAPKWQFFLEIGRDKAELVDFPQFFGYSLENRIRPRYKVIMRKQLVWTLNRMLTTSDETFEKLTSV